jgi:hypothetical protein
MRPDESVTQSGPLMVAIAREYSPAGRAAPLHRALWGRVNLPLSTWW